MYDPLAVTVVECCTGSTRPERYIGVHAFELCLPTRGLFSVSMPGYSGLADATMAFMGAPGHPADIGHPYPGGHEYVEVLVSTALYEELSADGHVPQPAIRTTPWIRWLTHQLHAAVLARAPDPWLVEELALDVFIAALAQDPVAMPVLPPGGARSRMVDDARAMLVSDPRGASLNALAADLGCSPYHLSRRFSQETGAGIARFRMSMRVDAAMRRLVDGETDLAQLAVDCGFADQPHLTRALTAHVGMSPAGARERFARIHAGDPGVLGRIRMGWAPARPAAG